MFTFPVGFWNPISQGAGTDPHANNVVLFLRADQSTLVTNTTTTANFTVPAVNSTVTINVVSSAAWAAANRAIRIGNGAGNYIITAVPNGTELTIRNCGGTDNAAAGTVISSTATIALSIIDSSVSPNTIEAAGLVQLSTEQVKPGFSSSIRTDQGSFAYIDPTPSIVFGDSDFTIEAFVYFTSQTQTNLIDFRYGTWNKPTLYQVSSSLRYFDTADRILASIPMNSWFHIAAVRSDGIIQLYVNGSQVDGAWGSVNSFGGYTGNSGFSLGSTSGFSALAYSSHIRLTIGIARYTANFNPETDTFLN